MLFDSGANWKNCGIKQINVNLYKISWSLEIYA